MSFALFSKTSYFAAFLIPSYLAQRAYAVSTNNLPGHPVGSKEYNSLVQRTNATDAKMEMLDFLNYIGMRKDLIIQDDNEALTRTYSYIWSTGTSYFTGACAAIYFHPELRRVDKEAYFSLMKREIYLIKNNDFFKNGFLCAISTLATAIFTTYTSSSIVALSSTALVGLVTHLGYSFYSESKADDFANTHSSVDELKGRLRFYKAKVQTLINLRNTHSLNAFISPSGEDRWNFSSPSYRSRIEKIEKILRQKNVVIDDNEEAPKMEKMNNFIQQCYEALAGNGVKQSLHE